MDQCGVLREMLDTVFIDTKTSVTVDKAKCD
jgi:hypothetical protein